MSLDSGYKSITGLSIINADSVNTHELSAVEFDVETLLTDTLGSFNNAFIDLQSDLIPDTHDTYDLGSATKNFATVFSNKFNIGSNTVLSGTTLGSTIVSSSLTSTGALNSGSITSGFGSVDIGTSALGFGTATAVTAYKIGADTVLSAGILGSTITSSSLTSVGTLNSGRISSSFGNIDIGSSNFTGRGLTLNEGDITQLDGNINANPFYRLGSDLSNNATYQTVYHSGAQTIDYLLFKTITDSATADAGLFRFEVDDTDILDINDGGIDLKTGFEYLINDVSVLNATTLGSSVVSTSITSTGALNSGSITSGFGNIDTGVSTINSGDIVTTANSGTDSGIQLLPSYTNAANASGRIYWKEASTSALYGFSLGYNGEGGSTILNWGNNTFNISRHNNDATGSIVLTIARTQDIIQTVQINPLADATYDLGSSSVNWNEVYSTNYVIGSNTVLSGSTLGSTITSSSLTSVGQLTSLNVDDLITVTNNDVSTTGGKLLLVKNRGGGACVNGDSIGRWETNFENSAPTTATGTIVEAIVDDITHTSEDTSLHFHVKNAGSTTDTLQISGTGCNLVTGLDYLINDVSVINETTLGSSVVSTSITSTGALNSGSITSGFGNIDTGVSTINSGDIVTTANSGTDSGIQLLPSYTNAANASGRIYWKEASTSALYGFSLGYNGEGGSTILNWGNNTFNISRHNNDATGSIVLTIARTQDIIQTVQINPLADATYDFGASGRRWVDIYATNATIQTSDERNKKDIKECDLGKDFINSLRPICYKWKEGIRKHYGLTAQDVSLLTDSGIYVDGEIKYKEDLQRRRETEEDFVEPDESKINMNMKGIRYNELIAPLIKAFQQQSKIIEDLESRVKILENKI